MLREAGQGEPRLHVPATVYNAILNRPEPVLRRRSQTLTGRGVTAHDNAVSTVVSDFRQ